MTSMYKKNWLMAQRCYEDAMEEHEEFLKKLLKCLEEDAPHIAKELIKDELLEMEGWDK